MNPQLIELAWKTGNLSILLRNGQKIVKQAYLKENKTYWEAHRRFGKSTLLLFLMLEECIRNPNTRCLFLAPVKEGLKDYVVPVIRDCLSTCPENIKPQVHKSDFTITFSNGSEVLFRGINNKQFNIRRGSGFKLIGIDEGRDATDLSTVIQSVVIPSLFDRDGRYIISSTPADSEDHDLKTYRDRSIKRNRYLKHDIHDSMASDSEIFTEARVKMLHEEFSDLDAWQREFECKWVRNLNLTIIPEWHKDYIKDLTRDNLFQFYHKYVSVDSGVKDSTALLFGYYDFRTGKLVIEDEGTLQGTEVRTDKISELIKIKELDLKYVTTYRRVADNNNLILIQDLNMMYNLNFFPTSKDSLDAMVNKVRLWINDGRLVVNSKCKMLIGNLENASWNKDKTEFAHSKTYYHFDHLAALMYLIRNLDTTTNPIPPAYAKTFDHLNRDHFIPPGVNTNPDTIETARRLERQMGPKVNMDIEQYYKPQ
jgi:PBSX family phage terminase large subunit